MKNEETIKAVVQLLENARQSLSLADTMTSETMNRTEKGEWEIYSLISGAWNNLYGVSKAVNYIYKTMKDE